MPRVIWREMGGRVLVTVCASIADNNNDDDDDCADDDDADDVI